MTAARGDRQLDKAAEVIDVRGEVMRRRTRSAAVVDAAGRLLASPTFFISLLASHVGWIVLNLPIWPYEPWDPYPYTFLATVTSAEAPFIALLVLMHQQRESNTAELREDIDLQTSLHLEREVTTLIRLVEEIQQKLGVQTDVDPERLKKQAEELDPKRLMNRVREKLDSEDTESGATSL